MIFPPNTAKRYSAQRRAVETPPDISEFVSSWPRIPSLFSILAPRNCPPPRGAGPRHATTPAAESAQPRRPRSVWRRWSENTRWPVEPVPDRRRNRQERSEHGISEEVESHKMLRPPPDYR